MKVTMAKILKVPIFSFNLQSSNDQSVSTVWNYPTTTFSTTRIKLLNTQGSHSMLVISAKLFPLLLQTRTEISMKKVRHASRSTSTI